MRTVPQPELEHYRWDMEYRMHIRAVEDGDGAYSLASVEAEGTRNYRTAEACEVETGTVPVEGTVESLTGDREGAKVNLDLVVRLKDAEGFTAVIHCAGYTIRGAYVQRPMTLNIHVEGNLDPGGLLETTEEIDSPVLTVSREIKVLSDGW